jgi:hypothetical protein
MHLASVIVSLPTPKTLQRCMKFSLLLYLTKSGGNDVIGLIEVAFQKNSNVLHAKL